jgi:hypothetical protein
MHGAAKKTAQPEERDSLATPCRADQKSLVPIGFPFMFHAGYNSRMSGDRKKPGVALWTTVVVLVVTVYVASYPPVWAFNLNYVGTESSWRLIGYFYRPIIWAHPRMPKAIRLPYQAYKDECYLWFERPPH